MSQVGIEHNPQIGNPRVIRDSSDYDGHVGVENAGGQRFPVPAELIDNVAYLSQKIEIWFDYAHQAWVEDGRFQRCAHTTLPCNCYGRLHQGELWRSEADYRSAVRILQHAIDHVHADPDALRVLASAISKVCIDACNSEFIVDPLEGATHDSLLRRNETAHGS